MSSKDIFPPGKITDLSAEHTNSGTLRVYWTAPGGDYINGSIVGYNIVSSLDINQMLDQKQRPDMVISINRTKIAGINNMEEVNIAYFDIYFYLGVVAFDQSGNIGRMSNIVLVFNKSAENSKFEPFFASDDAVLEDDWMMLGVVCGVLLVSTILIIVVLIYCYCLQGKPSRENISYFGETDATDDIHSEVTEEESCNSEIYLKKYEEFVHLLNPTFPSNCNLSGLTVLSLQSSQC